MSALTPIDPATATGQAAELLALSEAIALNRGQLSDADLDAARQAGVTDAEIGEVVGNLALNVLTNYFNILAGVDNDWPVVKPVRSAA